MKNQNFALFISKISQRIQNSNHLEFLLEKFKSNYGLVPVVGFELEFYVSEKTNIKKIEELIGRTIKIEKGNNQYEIDLEPSSNIIQAIEDFYHYKSLLTYAAEEIDGDIIYNCKPDQSDYGSSVHIHINFLNHNGENFFESEESILHGSRSICHFLLETFLVFANELDHFNRLNSNYMNPTNISMGKNNRTTCLRIPYSSPKRIEHRLSHPDIDLYIAIYVIVKSIYNGLQNPESIPHYDIIYGNAFDSQYNCKPFPKNIKEAKDLFNIDFFTVDL